MLRQVLTEPDPRLREGSRPATVFDAKLRRLADDLIETMIAGEGIGIAAPQVGEALRVIVVDWGLAMGKRRRPVVLVNPIVSAKTRDSVLGEEGCLSLPGRKVWVARSSAIHVHAQRLSGQHMRVSGDGLVARVLQHELEHLDGTLITDYEPAPARKMVPRDEYEESR